MSDAATGPKGDQGERGEKGAAGLSGSVRRALVYLFTLSVLLAGLNLLYTAHAVHVSQAAQQAAKVREQAAQRAAGVALERKLCTTFAVLAALQPPPGDPKANPSRAYLQGQHAALVQLGADVGCK